MAEAVKGTAQQKVRAQPTPLESQLQGMGPIVLESLGSHVNPEIQFGDFSAEESEAFRISPRQTEIIRFGDFDTEEVSKLMLASANLPDAQAVPAIKVNGQVAHSKAKLLIDGGSEGNFISQALVSRLKLKTVKLVAKKQVQGFNGESCYIDQAVPNISLKMGAQSEQITLCVAPLQLSADVVLGMPWLQKHNPHIDWRQRLITFRPKSTSKQPITVQGTQTWDPSPDQKPSYLLSATQFCNAAKKKGSTVFSLHVSAAQISPDTSQTQDSALQNVLDEFTDVFPAQLPDGLPPDRGIAHRIELEPGSALCR